MSLEPERTSLWSRGLQFFNWIYNVGQTETLTNAANLGSPGASPELVLKSARVDRGTTPTENDTVADSASQRNTCTIKHELPTSGSRLDEEWRLRIYYAFLESGKGSQLELWQNKCDFGELFVPGTVSALPRTTSSDSIIVMGILRAPTVPLINPRLKRLQQLWSALQCDVVLKITFPELYIDIPKPQLPNIARAVKPSLDCEIEIYQFVSRLVIDKVTPNLVLGLAYWQCPNLQSIQSTFDFNLKSEIFQRAKTFASENGKETLLAATPVNMLLLERGRGQPLSDRIDYMNQDELLSVVFQVLYTLNVLNRRLVRHGDLHLGNVFIDVLNGKESSTINYILSDETTYFHVPTFNSLAKLYDWDFGGIYGYPEYQRLADSFNPQPSNAWPHPTKPILNATAVDKCAGISSCGKNTKADAFTFLSNLHNLIKTVEDFMHRFYLIVQFIERNIDPQLLELHSSVLNEKAKEKFLAENPNPKPNQSIPSFLETRGGFQYRLCSGLFDSSCRYKINLKRDPIGHCSGSWQPDDCVMKTPEQMLRDPVFNMWRRSLNSKRVSKKDSTPYVYGDWSSEPQKDLLIKYFKAQS